MGLTAMNASSSEMNARSNTILPMRVEKVCYAPQGPDLIHNISFPLSAGPKTFVLGPNGAGKTTTIGKLAKRLQNEGKSVMLAAGDTFRAAAVEQLQVWGERNAIPVIAQGSGADSASVIFDAVEAARARKIDVIIADTAGRLHTQTNLMEELKKVHRVIGKLDATAPHEVLLVLDAGTGQNALNQAQHFHQAVEVSGIALTKLDGTAKGGMIFSVAEQLQPPIRYIGVGETVDDLRPFDQLRPDLEFEAPDATFRTAWARASRMPSPNAGDSSARGPRVGKLERLCHCV